MTTDAKKDVDAGYTAAPAVVRLRQLPELNDAALQSVAADKGEDVSVRREALRCLLDRDLPDEERIDLALELVEDSAASPRLRRDALQQAGLLAFNRDLYDQRRPRYIDVLRAAAKAADPELRLLALERLAVEKDEPTLNAIRDGIGSPETALVPLADAIGLLSYDPKAENFPVLEKVVDESNDAEARALALRALAADGSSTARMERMVTDRSQPVVVRRAAAAGLRSLDHSRLRHVAKQIALDESEEAEMRAASFTALSTFEDEADDDVVAGAEKASKDEPQKPLTKGAQSYLQRRR